MTVAIINAHIVPVTATPFDGTLVCDQGRITALGPNVDIPHDARIVDAGGRWLLPGLVEAHGHNGIWEESHGWAGQDANEVSEAAGARFRALDGIHPDDEGFRDALSGAVTTIVVKPGSASPIGGQSVAMKTWGRIVDEMVIKAPCSLKAALGENPKNYYGTMQKKAPITRMGVAAILREAFVGAQNYADQREHAARTGELFARDLDNDVLADVLSGEVPLCMHCHRVDDVATAIRLAEEFGYRLIINHGTEAHLIADYVAAQDVPVLIGPLFTSRDKQELAGRTTTAPGILARAGVKIAIMTDHPVVPIHYLIFQAIVAVKDGLDRETALRAITINPAEILGIDGRVGSLEVGKDADLGLWSGDPFELSSRVESVFVEGRQVYQFDPSTNLGSTIDPYLAENRA